MKLFIGISLMSIILFSCQENDNHLKITRKVDTLYFPNENQLYPTYTDLKNGYTLHYFVYRSDNGDTLQELNLVKNQHKIKNLGGGAYGLRSNLGFIKGDYDEELLVCYCSSTNPWQMELVQKNNGKTIISGTYVDALEDEELILFLNGDDWDVDTTFYVLDLENHHLDSFPAPTFTRDLFTLGLDGLWDAAEFISATDSAIFIKEYVMEDSIRVIGIKREIEVIH